jgi:hypothetical protein
MSMPKMTKSLKFLVRISPYGDFVISGAGEEVKTRLSIKKATRFALEDAQRMCKRLQEGGHENAVVVHLNGYPLPKTNIKQPWELEEEE